MLQPNSLMYGRTAPETSPTERFQWWNWKNCDKLQTAIGQVCGVEKVSSLKLPSQAVIFHIVFMDVKIMFNHEYPYQSSWQCGP